MDEIVDTVHRVGRKEERRTRQLIIQFVGHEHRKEIWGLTKESEICKQVGVHFTEDLTMAEKKAREVLWPKIDEARRSGKKGLGIFPWTLWVQLG